MDQEKIQTDNDILQSEKQTGNDAFKIPDKITFQLPKAKKTGEVSKSFSQTQTSPKTKLVASKEQELNQKNREKEDDDGSTNLSEDDIKTDSPSASPEEVSPTSESKSSKVVKVDTKYAFPAQQLSQGTVPYKEPSWGGACDDQYKFEVLRNGAIIDNVDLCSKSFHVFGRLPSCDVTLEHPSLSRHHAVVQYCSQKTEKHDSGWYLYDLDSTHGTWVNKIKVKPKVYTRIRVGHMVKFGGSTRLFILQGPDTDAEEESELSVTEIKEQRERQKKEVEVLRLAEMEEQERKAAEQEKRRELSGCSWGMDEEEVVEESKENPFSLLENEELYINDPKKSLKGFFEREGYDPPEYELEEAGFGKYKCQVELPIDTPTGQSMIAEVVVSGKKKEAVVECALEACRILDRHGMLRNATHESRKKKRKNWEDEDFYDSDEDTFLDRTGDIEKKRSMRMKKAGKLDKNAQTYDSLIAQHKDVTSELEEIEAKLAKAKRDAEAAESGDIDALDAYMMSIKSGAMDTKTKMKLKCRQLELRKEELRLRKLVNIAKPASLPEINKMLPVKKSSENANIPSIGKRKVAEQKPKKPLPLPTAKVELSEDFIEEEEDDEMEDSQSNSTSNSSANQIVNEPKHLDTAASKKSSSVLRNQSSDSREVTQEADTISMDTESEKKTAASVVKSAENKNDLKKTDSQKIDFKPPEKQIYVPSIPKKPKTLSEKVPGNYDSTDPDFAVWLPPTGQTGDGKTHLNDKYGY